MKSLFLALSLASSAAVAADADLLRCLVIGEVPARLACYDGLATAVRDAKAPSAIAAAAVPIAAPAAAVAAAAAQNFGRPPAPAAQPAAADLLESRIDGSIDGWRPGSQLRLVNGQIWRVTGDNETSFAPLTNPKVLIRPGMMGSYFLEVEGLSFQVRVKRLQ